jgi:tRNA U55 pseudouridine synthase TruB
MTPLELVEIVVNKLGAKKGAFSGRLDPMACGITRIFLDENCRFSKEDLTAGKTYRFQMVLGVETTSSDMLGIPTIDENVELIIYKLMDRIETFMKDKMSGGYIQQLPKHCSMPVINITGLKKPLWWWAKEGRIGEVVIPANSRHLYNYYDLKLMWCSLESIVKKSMERIANISPKMDFKQSEILDCWKPYADSERLYPVVEMIVDVSTGFYIRQFVSDIGTHLDIPTTTLEIERLGYLKK